MRPVLYTLAMAGVADRVLQDLGRKLAELRRRKGLTQEELSALLDCTPQYLQRVEAGQENLTVRSLVKFGEALGVTVAGLFRPPRSRVIRVGRPPTKRARV